MNGKSSGGPRENSDTFSGSEVPQGKILRSLYYIAEDNPYFYMLTWRIWRRRARRAGVAGVRREAANQQEGLLPGVGAEIRNLMEGSPHSLWLDNSPRETPVQRPGSPGQPHRDRDL